MEKTISWDVQAQDAKFSGTLALISSWMIYEQGSYTVSHHCPEQPGDSKVRKYQPRLCKIMEASLWSWWNVQILSDLPGRDGHCSLHPDHSWPSWSCCSGLAARAARAHQPGFVSPINVLEFARCAAVSSQWISPRSESGSAPGPSHFR